jgi:hypothetical protein
MENTIRHLPNGDFEVEYVEPRTTWFAKPYEFARDRRVEEEIANEKQRRETEASGGGKSEDKQGSRQRNSHVPGSEWGHGH